MNIIKCLLPFLPWRWWMPHSHGQSSPAWGLAGSPGSRWRSTWAGGEGGGGRHSPGHVTVGGRVAASYEHDLPGLLQGDGTGIVAVVLQVELSSTCQQTAVTVTDSTLVIERHLALARLSCCCLLHPSPPIWSRWSSPHCGATYPSWVSRSSGAQTVG
jgi:hypothetical protein